MTESSRADLRPPMPLTVIGGFLGAGKTTLLNDLLGGLADRRLAVVVNDFGAVDIDGRLVAAVHDDVVSLTNGCICCTIRDGVAQTVLRLVERSDPPEHVVIEASGASEPGALAEVFIELQRVGYVRVDGLVTVVDTESFDPQDAEFGRLVRAQVTQADLVVLTKLDLVTEARADEVRAKIRSLQPVARIVDRADCPPEILLGLKDTAFARPEGRPSAIASAHPADFQTAHLRIEAPVSFRTFLPELTRLPTAVVRAKGWLNLQERPGDKILAHVVGRRLHVRTVGQWADEPDEVPRTELVFIGAEQGWTPEALVDHLRAAAG